MGAGGVQGGHWGALGWHGEGTVTPPPFQHDVELTDPRGRTPLELAVSLGHLESVRVLLRHNANVGRENANGWTGTGLPRGLGDTTQGCGLPWLTVPRVPSAAGGGEHGGP